jgi:hypothetical protein
MAALQRITTEYVEFEDRVRLTGQTEDGTITALWLTRRLLDRLIPHLTLWLEQQHAGLPRADVMLEFAQQKAQSQLIPQAPVQASNTRGQLVQAVDITPDIEQLHLNFKPEMGESAGIGFASTPLRQWLAILHQAYIAAEWPLTSWPVWMLESHPPALARNALWH